jgi:uncharacterized coiled-coil protein SlyX
MENDPLAQSEIPEMEMMDNTDDDSENTESIEPEELSTRQQILVYDLISIVEVLGQFGKGTDSEGSHYAPAEANPFKSQGLVCKNCAFYSEDSEACAIVKGNIEPEAICKFWVIENSDLGLSPEEPMEDASESEAASKYSGINFSPPEGVRSAARRGLALHEKGLSGDGLEPATVLWARKYAEGQAVSPERARMGNRFYGRNARFANAPKDSPAWVSWLLWGGSAGKSWFAKLVKQMDSGEKKSTSENKEKMNTTNTPEHSVASMRGKMTFAQDSTNPLLKSVELILTDFEANANNEGIPLSEAENIIRTAKFTPLKIAMSEDSYAGHKGAIPIGPITDVWQDTFEGKPVIKARAMIWGDEFKDVYSVLKSQATERDYIGTSWEVYYQDVSKENNINWLQNVTFAGTCIVDTPAYGERTKLLSVAEMRVQEIEAALEELKTKLTEQETTINELKNENDSLKAQAEADAKAKRQSVLVSKLLTAGFSQSKISENFDFYLTLDDAVLDKIIGDFVQNRSESSDKSPKNPVIPEFLNGGKTYNDPKVLANELKNFLKR